MALTETRPEHTEAAPAPRAQPTAVEQVLGTGDHKTVGRVFIGASLLFLAVDLVVGALVHFDGASDGSILASDVAAQLFMNHPVGLVLCGVMPLALGLAVYLVPLQIGAPTISFPRAAASSLWGWLAGSVLLGVATASNGSYGGGNSQMARLGNVSVGLLAASLLVGAVCVMATVLSLRAPGMTVGRVPFFSFSMLVTGALWLGTLPVVIGGVVLWHIQQPTAATLAAEGLTSIDWLFRQPAVFVLAIPVLGIALDVASAAAGARVRFERGLQSVIVGLGALSFGAWAQEPFARETFVWIVGCLLVGLPVLVVAGGVADTVRRGTTRVTAGLVCSLASLALLLLAAITALVQGVSTIGKDQLFSVTGGGFVTLSDATGLEVAGGPGLAVGQTYLVIGAAAAAGIGACFAWGTRIWGGGLPEGMGKGLAPLTLLGGAIFGLAQAVIGIAQPDADATRILLGVAGAGAVVLALAALGTFAAVVGKLRPQGAYPDERGTGGTLEWSASSPPPPGNFTEPIPAVESGWPLFDRNETGA